MMDNERGMLENKKGPDGSFFVGSILKKIRNRFCNTIMVRSLIDIVLRKDLFPTLRYQVGKYNLIHFYVLLS